MGRTSVTVSPQASGSPAAQCVAPVPSKEPSVFQACDPNPAGSLSNGASPKAALGRPSWARTRSDRVWLVGLWGFCCPKSTPLAVGNRAVLLPHQVQPAGTVYQGLTLDKGESHAHLCPRALSPSSGRPDTRTVKWTDQAPSSTCSWPFPGLGVLPALNSASCRTIPQCFLGAFCCLQSVHPAYHAYYSPPSWTGGLAPACLSGDFSSGLSSA